MLPKRRKPTHPGVILSEDFLKPLELTALQFANALGTGWTEKKINDIIEGKEHISEKTAAAFAAALETSPHFWMRLQHQFQHAEEVHRQNEKGSQKSWKKAG